MEKHIAIRQCAACRTKRAKGEFLRVVRTADGQVSLDERGKLSGRGVYLCADPACFKRVIKSRAVERALSAPMPPDLPAQLEARIAGGGDG